MPESTTPDEIAELKARLAALEGSAAPQSQARRPGNGPVIWVLGIGGALALGFAAWFWSASPAHPLLTAPHVAPAEAAVAAKMRDPTSVMFSNVRQTSTGFVCGQVNAKNAFGAYAGTSRFYVEYIGDEMRDTDVETEGDPQLFTSNGKPTSIFDIGWDSFCK